MGRGRGKGGKSRKGKGHGQSSEQSAAAKQHAAEINARRRAEGKETRSTGSIARSQRRAQAHHAAKSKAAPGTDCGVPDPRSGRLPPSQQLRQAHTRTRKRRPWRVSFSLPGLRQRLGHSSKSRLSPRFSAQALKKAKPEEPRAPASRDSTKEEPASAANRCEEAEKTEVDCGTGEALPVAAATKEESVRLRDDQPAGSQEAGPGELLPGHAVDEARALTAPARTEAATAGVAVSDDEYTSESTEEVPTLQGTPLTMGVRLWYPSQMPHTLKLIRNLRTGELLPAAVELSKLGYGRTRAAYTLPPEVHLNFPQESVLKLCTLKQHRGKEADWARHSPLVAPTYHQGEVAVDYGVEARYLHFSIQLRAAMASAWIAQYGANGALTLHFALYMLATLFSLELRGAVLVDVGPSNLMISAVVAYPTAVYGDTAGWDVNPRARHRGHGGFANLFKEYPSALEEIQRITSRASKRHLPWRQTAAAVLAYTW